MATDGRCRTIRRGRPVRRPNSQGRPTLLGPGVGQIAPRAHGDGEVFTQPVENMQPLEVSTQVWLNHNFNCHSPITKQPKLWQG